jgi:hypothetical protein
MKTDLKYDYFQLKSDGSRGEQRRAEEFSKGALGRVLSVGLTLTLTLTLVDGR